MMAVITGQFLEIITLFTIVIIHELGHVFAAISYGWKIKEIQLLPFGGMASIEESSQNVWEEFIVAIAGPLQNFTMIFVAIAFQRFNVWSDSWTTFFIQANMVIGLFNLLPISPLDGSKMVKALLFIYFPFRRAMLVSIFVSIVLIIVIFLYTIGFIYDSKININMMILTVFFLYNNIIDIKQYPYVYWRFLLNKTSGKSMRNVKAVSIMINKDTKIIHALNLLYKGKYHLFYLVSDNGEIEKIIPEEKLLRTVIDNKGLNTTILEL